MPITIGCPICPYGTLRGDQLQGAFVCDMCEARMPPSRVTEDERTVAICPCRKCRPNAIAS